MKNGRVRRPLASCGGAILLLASAGSALGDQVCSTGIVASTPDANFAVSGDGTATHKTTGLMWTRCSLGQVWDGTKCAGQAESYAWGEALRAAKNSKFAGYTDWRLPNKNELESLVEERCVSPSINAKVFPDSPSSYYWSSTPYAGSALAAWSVDFSFGAVNASVKSGRLNVRLVRGGE